MYLLFKILTKVVVASDLPAMNKTIFLQRATWELCQTYAAQQKNISTKDAQKTSDSVGRLHCKK